MSAFSSTSIPHPKDWQDFERKSRVLFECILGDPQTQTHGRGGQEQDGVDIFGRRDGGAGPLVGVQCKGKDGQYGKNVTEVELRREIEKTTKFKPPLNEFILITTAPDDKNIQEKARLLGQEIRSAGRPLSVAVWGWNTLEQRISEHHRAINAFHPDATPISDQLLEGTRFNIEAHQRNSEKLDYITALLQEQRTVISAEPRQSGNADDKHFDAQIDQYRTLIQTGKSQTALSLLQAMQQRVWDEASDRIKFRILANMGAAHHNLGAHLEAAELFLEGAPYNPEDPVAIANKVAGLLIKGDKENARIEAEGALARFPESSEIALQRLQARGPDETIAQVWDGLSEEVRDDPQITAMHIMMLRNEGGTGWRQAAEEAFENHRDVDRLQRLAAEAALDGILESDPSFLGSAAKELIDENRLRTAAAIFKKIWDASLAAEGGPDAFAAHNGAVTFLALGDDQQAGSLADAALSYGVAVEQTKKLRIMLYLQHDQTKEAIALARSLQADPERELGLAELFVESDPKQARDLIATVQEQLHDDKLRIAAATIMVESFITEKDWPSAHAEAERIRSELPDHPIGPILKYRVLATQGDKAAKDSLVDAFGHLKPETDFASRYLVARTLEHTNLHELAAQALEGHIDETRDSPALRTFLAAAQNADRRVTVAKVLAKLPATVAENVFFLRLRVALAIRSGDVPGTEKAVRNYLLAKPRDLGMQLQLLLVFVRQNKAKAIQDELARPLTDFDGSPEDWIQLALFLDTYGHWKKAHKLAYSIWLQNQSNPVVNLRYTGVFLRPGHSKEMPVTLDVVGPDAAFGLRRGNERQKFVIEPETSLRMLPYTIAPEHPIAVAAQGKRVGEVIEVGAFDSYEIEWIKPKQLDALHHILETFNLYFPGTEGLYRVTIKDESSDTLNPVLDIIKERVEAIEAVFDMYEQSPLPLDMVARSLGSDPVETFLGLIESGRIIRVCKGNHPERDTALMAIHDNEAKGCVVDDVTLHLIRRLGLEDMIQAVCGPIGIVDHTIGRLQQRHYDISSRADEPDMSIGWRDGQAYKNEVSVEQKREAIVQIEADIAWIEANTDTLSAQGRTDIPQELRELVRRFGPGFADEFLAAQSNDRLLLCEDMARRIIGIEKFGLRASWLQPVLMVALDRGVIDRDNYNKAILAMLAYRASFISIDKGVLLGALKGTTTVPLPKDYTTASDALGGANAEFISHIRVAAEALSDIWDGGFPHIVKSAATGALLEVLLKQHWKDTENVIRLIKDFARQNLVERRNLISYINQWLKGHFLVAPAK